ncbi:MAG: tRNA (adenosine(37)-N6)-threonylcarbamoyltransferase complex dimerization subunit type 1 TsaB [Thermodesulfovibrionales bacterium]|nr:tRNA (adenosine(37)-N6)-threonylcarbamoyltransferase complex dimerization subunit type 1 TsaB [Thermodesulfovibrionales bacterium]
MRLLAIETASQLGGLAVMDSDTGLVAECRLNVHATHSETLMGEVHHVLRLAGSTAMELDAIAVSCGPGAFTGLRVGLGTAKGLAFASGARIVAVPTLEAYALSLPFTRSPVAPMLDARRREVYAGLFSVEDDGTVRRLIEEQPVSASAFMESISGYESIVFAGQGALIYKDAIIEGFRGKAIFAPAQQMHPSPASVAELGMRLARAGVFSDPETLCPMYIRKSEAETPRQRKP